MVHVNLTEIKVYSKPDCSQCRFLKRFLDERHIDYREYDVTQDEEAMAHVKELGFYSLPVVEGPHFKAFSGFNLMELKKVVAPWNHEEDD